MLWLHTLSHPMWVRGLKHEASDFAHLVKTSHPMWVRGLKQASDDDEDKNQAVAPHVGAWIETCYQRNNLCKILSHPMWVRGLKLPVPLLLGVHSWSHPMWVRGLKQQT